MCVVYPVCPPHNNNPPALHSLAVSESILVDAIVPSASVYRRKQLTKNTHTQGGFKLRALFILFNSQSLKPVAFKN